MYHQQQQQQHHQSQFYRPAPYTAAQESTTPPANPAPQVHRHLPPAIHCPPKRQQPESPVQYIPTGPEVHRPPKRVHESPVPYNIPTGPEVHRPPKRVQHQQPALVSPSAAASPRTPQPSLKSSPPRHHQAVTPVCKNTSNAAAEIVSTANLVTSKPPRPYTEYTMFYQLEREYILRRLLTNDDDKKSNSSPSDDDAADGQTALFQNDPLMPAQFRDLPLRADWYISGKSKKPTKRKHRKSHGKIGFLELTRMIAARWAKVDDETRKYCKMMAAMELVKYKEDMESYNLYKERLSAMGQIPQDMMERIRKKKMQSKKKKADTMAKNNIKKSGGPARASRRSAPPPPPLPPAILRADPVNSSVMTTPAAPPMLPLPKLEPTVIYQPLAHNSPPIQQQGSNLDNDMEQFITSLVRSPNRPTSVKAITPDRSASPAKKRRLFRDRSAGSTTAAALESIVPLKGSVSGVDLDGIKMTFSGIDENEIAREFSESVHRAGPAMKAPGRSFDYWDAFAGI